MVVAVAVLCLPHMAFAQVASIAATSTATVTPIDPYNPADVELRVRDYFKDVPSMAAIAKCESSFRQYGDDGHVLFDPSYSMIGVFQISAAHLPESIGLGMDIMTLDGNLAYARRLYTQGGIDPWMDSFGCWGNVVKTANQSSLPGMVLGTSTQATSGAAPVSPAPAPAITAIPSVMSLSLGMTNSSILALQQMLNKLGFAVAASGAGSLGQETTRFGSLTRDAVRRFQCAKLSICSGNESTTGYGMVDDRTYQALQAAMQALSPVAVTTPAPTPAAPSYTLTAASNTSVSSASSDKAAQIAQVQSQIVNLTNQLDQLNKQLNTLTK